MHEFVYSPFCLCNYFFFFLIAEVGRLFSPYRGQNVQQRASRSLNLPSYTHTFCCLSRKDAALVPTRAMKYDLASAGLGEKRLTFQGMFTSVVADGFTTYWVSFTRNCLDSHICMRRTASQEKSV